MYVLCFPVAFGIWMLLFRSLVVEKWSLQYG